MASDPDLQVMSPSAADADMPMALVDAPQPVASQQLTFRQASPRSPPIATSPADHSQRSEPYSVGTTSNMFALFGFMVSIVLLLFFI